MEVVYVVIGIMIGFAVSSIIRRKHPVGFLRIDKSDPDGPYLFLELKKSVNEIVTQRTVLLRLVPLLAQSEKPLKLQTVNGKQFKLVL